jgi:hypothetical protein
MEDPLSLADLEVILSTHRGFADSTYIHQQLQLSYQLQLGRISAHLPAAGHLLEAVREADDHSRYRLLGDTSVRCAIQHALTAVETGRQEGIPLDECEEAFRAAAAHLAAGKRGAPLESGAPQVARLGPEADHPWVWSEEHTDDVFGRLFRYIVVKNFGDPLCTPSDDELENLKKGMQLLSDLAPLLSRSALSHTHMVALFPRVGGWKGRASCSQFRVGGTIFLSRESLRNPWWVAEHLLHESLHQKLYDFRRGHSLFQLDPQRAESPQIYSPWNVHDAKGSNYWDVFRAVAACHVYVHLVLLCMLAESRAAELEPRYGPIRQSPAMTYSRAAFERAYYLCEQIRQSAWEELGVAGKRLIEWLSAVLDVLEPYPPPNGAYVHLLLDLYAREATKADSVLRKSRSEREELRAELAGVIQPEVATTRRVLSMLDAEAALKEFNETLARYPEEIPGDDFPQVRGIIVRTLRDVSADGYSLKRRPQDAESQDKSVQEMVRQSSERLQVIFDKH